MATVTTSKTVVEVTVVLSEEEAKYLYACLLKHDPKSGLGIEDPFNALNDAFDAAGIDSNFSTDDYLAY